MKKRILTGALAITLALGTMGVSAFAAENNDVIKDSKPAIIEKVNWNEKSVEEIAAAKGITVQEYQAMQNTNSDKKSVEEIATAKDMTVEEYEALTEKKSKSKMSEEELAAALEAKGITMEEYKAMLAEKTKK